MLSRKVIICFSNDKYVEMQNIAIDEHKTVSSLIRQAVLEYIERKRGMKALLGGGTGIGTIVNLKELE